MIIGVRVSATPRSTPVVTPCTPSNSWNTAATKQQGRAERQHRFVSREQADERPRDEQKRDGRDGHEHYAEQDGGPACCGRAIAVERPDRVADAHGAR